MRKNGNTLYWEDVRDYMIETNNGKINRKTRKEYDRATHTGDDEDNVEV